MPSDVLPFYSTAESGTVSGNVYYATGTNVTDSNNLPENNDGIKTQPFSNASTIGEITTNLNSGQSIFKQDTSDSVPYNLMKQSLTTYTYPVLTYQATDGTRTSFIHYGDWEATFQVGALVYYEEYCTFDKNRNASLPTYGFYGANVDSTLKDDPNITVVGDGYGLVYRKSGDVLPENVTVIIQDGNKVVKKTSFSLKSLTPKLVTYDGVQYNVYPFRAVVTDLDGNRVHYGDWLDDENMGTVGIFYWERETGGKNNGYHFTYLGTNDGKAIGGTSLCTSHDDGGIIAEYGYGFFELNKGSVKKLTISGATTNNGSELDLSQGIVYNTVASEALQKQM